MELLLHGTMCMVVLVVVVLTLAVVVVKALPSAEVFPKWVAIWLIVSTLICLWDASFVMFRPDSFDIMLWAPYADYIRVDKLYGNVDDSFVWSQSVMNIVECGLNIYALLLLRDKKFRAAAVMAVVVSTMTSSKTILYHLMEYACGFCNTAHNDAFTLVMLYFLPNGVWIWVPAFVAFHLGGLLSESPAATSKRKKNK
jgi:hypothetical protein